MSDIILHHYEGSPFAHKARLLLGFKGLAWRSVEIPMVMPKPELMPLTGGYRRTPVMQIGADVYCDTRLIADELERRHPEPTLFPAGGKGMAEIVTSWADNTLFVPITNAVFSTIADKLPAAFFADRAAMRGAQPPDVERMMKAAPRLQAEMGRLMATVETIFDDGRDYVLGDKPGLADIALYHPIWMATTTGRRNAALLEPFTATRAWMDRVAAIGIGDPQDMEAKEALAAAKGAEPEPPRPSEPDAAAPGVGQTVSVISADKVPEAVVGEVVLVTADEVAIRRDDPAVGTVHVHFPRSGYLIRPA